MALHSGTARANLISTENMLDSMIHFKYTQVDQQYEVTSVSVLKQ